jgi:AraC family ethanolamine operon transcriptional activator
VRNAFNFVAANDRLPSTVSEFCRQAGVSAPSLYRGFMERFGIGPKRYLHIRRLEGVRRELRSAPPEVRIVDVANGWGFWHMGRFAADYRKQFGELPSQTLHGAHGF